MALFKTENMSFTYPECKAKTLDNINIEINSNDFILLMGKTGSGKSTLLRLLNEAIAPAGTLTGSIIRNTTSIGYVGQNPELTFVGENVRSELAFSLENKGFKREEISMKIGETASFFNLSDMLDCKLSELSGGEKATVAVASAMIDNTDVLLLDEPTAQLDSKASFELINLLKRVNSELGTAVVIASHMSDGIIDFCDRLIVLDDGNKIFDDNPRNATDDIIPFYPLSAQLFDSRPLTVKEALSFADTLTELPAEQSEITSEIIRLKNISFAYGRNERDILDRLDFVAYENKIHAIIGANGSGKTTLLKVIAGVKKAYSGKAKVLGKVAYLPQNPQYLFTRDTVLDEIGPDTAIKFKLDKYINNHPYDLSGGQQQLLALAILSRLNYDILLLDEPSRALDVFAKQELKQYLRSLGKTVIMVSHDLDFVGECADYVSFLSDGIITVAGDRRNVLSQLDFYTTQIRRLTKQFMNNAVAMEDLK